MTTAAAQAPTAAAGGMQTRNKVLIVVGLYLLLGILLAVLLGSEGKNEEFKPQNEFKLDNWISLQIGPIDMSINKAVLYLFLGVAAHDRRLDLHRATACRQRPNRVQTAVETLYQLMKGNIAEGNMDRRMAAKWFTFVGTLFLFIWFSNLIGYLPLPTNTEHKVNVFGLELPTFALYAATANISVTARADARGVVLVPLRGHPGTRLHRLSEELGAGRRRGRRGRTDLRDRGDLALRPHHLAVRATVREHPRRPPADPVHGRRTRRCCSASPRSGRSRCLSRSPSSCSRSLLIATLQAFIFATLTAIYLGGATAGH